MAMKENRPTWFKMFRSQKALFDSVSDRAVGRAVKAAFQYFDNGEVPPLTPLELALFSSIRPYIDESYADFEAASRKNSENVKKRWAKRGDTGGICRTSGIQSLPDDTKNTEAEADTPYGVDASEAERDLRNGDAALVGGPPARFYYDPVLGRVVDREEVVD